MPLKVWLTKILPTTDKLSVCLKIASECKRYLKYAKIHEGSQGFRLGSRGFPYTWHMIWNVSLNLQFNVDSFFYPMRAQLLLTPQGQLGPLGV